MTIKQKGAAGAGLVIGSLGVVFGDIGTSPLYALKTAFGLPHMQRYLHDTLVIHGLLSLLLWTVTVVVSVKYIGFVMRASNKGEGGIMALVSAVSGSRLRRKLLFIGLGLIGVALFYGDSVVTPAISVLSAAEGLKVISPPLDGFIIPVTLVLITLLFGLQKYGTSLIGELFGPVMLAWFMVIGLGGAWQVYLHPAILDALLPIDAITFIVHHPLMAFTAMSAVVLAITGAEALYADMGHFGRPPIAKAWFMLVFPALMLCYLGQGALVLYGQQAVSNPFYELFPPPLRAPVLVLASAATLIASQAVISGAFSLTRQAIQLGFLPRMTIRQTSDHSFGQIYLPFVNAILFAAVITLVLTFGSSERLAGAYGVAVSGTLAIDTILFMATLRKFQHSPHLVAGLAGLLFLGVDVILVTANIPKVTHGGWLPLSLALAVLLVIRTWTAGQRVASRQRRANEPPLQDYITQLRQRRRKVVRLPGQAVYIGHHNGLAPTALRTAVEQLHELHKKAVIVYVNASTAAHVPPEERAAFDSLGYADGISQVTITYGFHDSPNIPKTLESIRHISPELGFDPYQAVYFISLNRIVANQRHEMHPWQKLLFTIMSRNALSTSDYYHLPAEKTVEMRTLISI